MQLQKKRRSVHQKENSEQMIQFINVLLQQTGSPNQVYLGTAQGEFKKRFHNHKSSFKNESKRNNTTLAKYAWDLKLKHNVTPTLKWHISKSVAPYLNITKKCRLILQEQFEILSNPILDELLNKRSKLVPKCCHLNKFLLANYKVND